MILKLSTTFIFSSSTENVIQVHELLSQAELFKLNFFSTHCKSDLCIPLLVPQTKQHLFNLFALPKPLLSIS
jgi:hypothetical protein